MSNFITKSACHGNRPGHLLSFRYYQRQRLVSRLIKERGVARFIVAPFGYGKTSLALEYADTIFGFEGVYWINCKSPCFIRDLDKGEIASSCVERDSKTKLVVFEDVPFLDAGRSEAFSREIDTLINRRCEVLVTCLPSCDTLGRLQNDRVTVTAQELMLDDEELSTSREGVPEEVLSRASQVRSCRVPILVWSQQPTSTRDFLSQTFREEAPSDLLLALACTAVLGSGSFSDLVSLGPIDRELVVQMAPQYPHLGFNDEFDHFEAPSFPVLDIAHAFRGTIDAFVKRSSCENREEFVGALADRLMATGRLERTCDVIGSMCPRKARISWVERHAYRLVSGSCFFPLLRLVESVRSMGMTAPQRSLLSTIEAVCLHVLGDVDGAARSAKRYAFEGQMPADHRILDLVILAKSSSNMLGQRALEELARLGGSASASQRMSDGFRNCAVLAQALSISALGSRELFDYWEASLADGVPDDLLNVIAAWFYDAYAAEMHDNDLNSDTLPLFDCGSVERFVRNQIAAKDQVALDFFSVSAGLAMEAAHVKGMGYLEGPLPVASVIALRNAEMVLLSQRNRYDAESVQSAIRREDWLATHPENALDMRRGAVRKQARLSVPTLSLKTFGHLEVSIGGQLVDQELFKGKHVRALIVLLAANQGRELSRDALCAAMWPRSSMSVAHKNFYTVWSSLRQALLLPDGSCPYLIRHRTGCCFDSMHVQSDIARFEAICRAFLFEEPDYGRWSDLLVEIDRDFSDDLLPSETSNELVVRTREEYRAKLVDALVAASDGIAETGNMRRAIWCAQLALDRDDTREDAYLALMRAQAASGQRAAAMATCRRGMHVLVEKLGLDPSPEMMEFYQRLLDSDDGWDAV